jgi:hypothetical protein
MRFIFRPLTPPRSLMEFTYAMRPFPVLLRDEAGPLNGKVAPTFISVSVTPGVSPANDGPTAAIAATKATINVFNTSDILQTLANR